MPLLDILDLKKSYRSPDGEAALVVNVGAFSLDPCDQVGLEGSSGSGKTTFLNLIGGILLPDQGTVRIDGQDVTRLPAARRDALRATTIGYIFQTFNLLQGYTALENVLLAMSFAGPPDRVLAQQLLAEVGLSDRARYRPSQLSTGQQQRVAVARAMANRPRLILADEPTGNLDPRRAGEALDLIRGMCQRNGAALLLVSHDRDVLGQFSRVQKFSDINRLAP